MDTEGRRRTGGRILIDQLRLHGADTIFGVPGESYIVSRGARGGRYAHYCNLIGLRFEEFL